MAIAEVVIEVGFENGQRAVFTVSPKGRLSPSQGDGVRCDASNWFEASQLLAGFGLILPHEAASAKSSSGRICWPWDDES